MVKSKTVIRNFVNFLFREYGVPRIPVYVYWYYDVVLVQDQGVAFGCYSTDDSDESKRAIHAVAGTKWGTNFTLRVLAHEFVHYLQDIHHREYGEMAEEEAAHYGDALVCKFLQNRRKRGACVDGVLHVWEPREEK